MTIRSSSILFGIIATLLLNACGGGGQGGGTCGIAGRYGWCEGSGCTGEILYWVKDQYRMTTFPSQTIAGAVNVDSVHVRRTELMSATIANGPDKPHFKFCPSRSLSDYSANVEVSSDSIQSGGSSFSIEGLAKVTATGLFGGDSTGCNISLWGGFFMLCPARPTSLATEGAPRWN